MSGNSVRLQAINAVTNHPYELWMDEQAIPSHELFGELVFDMSEMQKRLPKSVYKSLLRTIDKGDILDSSTADAVASAMKDWAISNGATHYTHVFYPLTGMTAEKHDSFLVQEGNGQAITEFSGKQLIQGEPDGSSFPTGGIRVTFEARGYTAWDVTSPAYILDNPAGSTLCIPTAFVSWTGEALDKKTPLLRSMSALNEQAQRVLKLFGDDSETMVYSTAGAEQEYFLVDRHFFNARPDLVTAGRTLFGAASPKGQQFDDHYFGAINERVLNYMLESERELVRLGVPVKTRHNEVAPGQYEIAPIFENANVATDHQQLVMTTLNKVATRHGFVCLMHEKPFAGVNGSGKHVNFSMGNANVGNLLEPGDTPHNNVRFLVFCSAVIRAVSKYAKLLRAIVASAGNDHRLGANEAPPAIISIFLGSQLSSIFQQIKNGENVSSDTGGVLNLGVDTLPPLPKHSGDRNRTSPFAFTGNKFEFRAVGSNQSIAGSLTLLNTIVAESLDYIADSLESASGTQNEAIINLIKEIYNEHGNVVFDGDGYSDEWHTAAVEDRGLANLKTSAQALPAFYADEAVEVFNKYNVLSPRELESHTNVYLEQYNLTIQLEANLTLEMGRTLILPAAHRYAGELSQTAMNLKQLGREPDTRLLDKVTSLSTDLHDALDSLEALMDHHEDDLSKEATYFCDKVLPQMEVVRGFADTLENYVADDHWPLPTYQEMLFIK